MKMTILSLLLFLSGSTFATCQPPERFTALENPFLPDELAMPLPEQAQFPVQIVNFWALWCAPCRAELPLLKKISATGIPVLLVNLGDDEMATRQFLEKIDVQNLPQIRLENSELLPSLGITGFPATFLLENGALRYRTQGALKSADEKALQSYVACVLHN